MKDFKVDVLGVMYDVLFRNQDDDKRLIECEGFCDKTTKTIVVDNFSGGESSNLGFGDKDSYISDIVRHEMVHAFLNESGLQSSSEWARNEEAIDWISLQLPKMVKAMSSFLNITDILSKYKFVRSKICGSDLSVDTIGFIIKTDNNEIHKKHLVKYCNGTLKWMDERDIEILEESN